MLLLSLAGGNAARAGAEVVPTPPPSAAAEKVPADVPAPVAQSVAERLDWLYARRDEAEPQAALARESAEALAKHPGDFELVWRAARTRCALAELLPDEARRQAEAKACWELGDRATAVNPHRAEGPYWAASGLGMWMETASTFQIMAQGGLGKLTERIDKAIAIDPGVDICFGLLLKGRLLEDAPWPIGNSAGAGNLFRSAVARCPQNLKAHLFLADWLAEQGDWERASASYKRAMSEDISYDPPDGRKTRAEAAAKLSKRASR